MTRKTDKYKEDSGVDSRKETTTEAGLGKLDYNP